MWSQQSSALACLIFAAGVPALPSASWGPWPDSSGAASAAANALYVMTNDVEANAIIAMSVGDDGTLSGGSSTVTGGKGSNLVNANGQPLFPDSLSVQDSVVSAGNYLFAVNAGSNTLSMFTVSPSNPLDVTLLGEPQDTKGVFPVSVAVSAAMSMACVANTGVPSGIVCATFSEQGLAAFDDLRAMDFGATQNPPVGPVPGVGDLLFSEDERSLLVMVKGGMNLTGFVAKFAVQDGTVSQTATVTTPPGSGALFGTGLIPASPNMVLASDASVGALILDVDDLASTVAVVNITGQKASCWARVSTVTGTGFITDVLVNRLVEVDVHSGAIITEYYPPTPFSGMSDFSTVGDFLWSLSAGNGSFPASISDSWCWREHNGYDDHVTEGEMGHGRPLE